MKKYTLEEIKDKLEELKEEEETQPMRIETVVADVEFSCDSEWHDPFQIAFADKSVVFSIGDLHKIITFWMTCLASLVPGEAK